MVATKLPKQIPDLLYVLLTFGHTCTDLTSQNIAKQNSDQIGYITYTAQCAGNIFILAEAGHFAGWPFYRKYFPGLQ